MLSFAVRATAVRTASSICCIGKLLSKVRERRECGPCSLFLSFSLPSLPPPLPPSFPLFLPLALSLFLFPSLSRSSLSVCLSLSVPYSRFCFFSVSSTISLLIHDECTNHSRAIRSKLNGNNFVIYIGICKSRRHVSMCNLPLYVYMCVCTRCRRAIRGRDYLCECTALYRTRVCYE